MSALAQPGQQADDRAYGFVSDGDSVSRGAWGKKKSDAESKGTLGTYANAEGSDLICCLCGRVGDVVGRILTHASWKSPPYKWLGSRCVVGS
jgi:hypothetical protein